MIPTNYGKSQAQWHVPPIPVLRGRQADLSAAHSIGDCQAREETLSQNPSTHNRGWPMSCDLRLAWPT